MKSWAKRNAVPFLFLIICVLTTAVSGERGLFIAREVITRLARNWVLVLSLLIPVTAGLGLNFGIVLGAMAGQIGLIVATHLKIPGITGIMLSVLISLPVAIVLGTMAGSILNRAKGREMITSMIIGFFVNGVYRLFFLFVIGTVIHLNNPDIVLSTGIGLKNTIELKYLKGALDNLLMIKPMFIPVPIGTFLIVAFVCISLWWLNKTKLGQDLRAVGQDSRVAAVAGIDVDRTRIVAMIISTVLAAIGQIIFLQNLGTINTYNSHEQIGTLSIASILVGGASVSRATVGHALLGTVLFQLLFISSPGAGQQLMGSPQIGEYFRVFVAYGIIAIALVLHSWQRNTRPAKASDNDIDAK
jgi:simple sugar transport system permease protein